MKHFTITNMRDGPTIDGMETIWVDIRQWSFGEITTFRAYLSEGGMYHVGSSYYDALVNAGCTNRDIEKIEAELSDIVESWESRRPRIHHPEVLLSLMSKPAA